MDRRSEWGVQVIKKRVCPSSLFEISHFPASPSGSSSALPVWLASPSSPSWRRSSCWAGAAPRRKGELTLPQPSSTSCPQEEGKRRKNHQGRPGPQSWKRGPGGDKQGEAGLNSRSSQDILCPGIFIRCQYFCWIKTFLKFNFHFLISQAEKMQRGGRQKALGRGPSLDDMNIWFVSNLFASLALKIGFNVQ